MPDHPSPHHPKVSQENFLSPKSQVEFGGGGGGKGGMACHTTPTTPKLS